MIPLIATLYLIKYHPNIHDLFHPFCCKTQHTTAEAESSGGETTAVAKIATYWTDSCRDDRRAEARNTPTPCATIYPATTSINAARNPRVSFSSAPTKSKNRAVNFSAGTHPEIPKIFELLPVIHES
ncbi:hypothetical protein Ahy_B06g079962 isoform D [Arachis hypogaea]|uniref:Uncharacterized protein n=1 Tax=Arachis hypogaea TaxID=3818 RepID=A0A444YGU8_ARAHY|nr:hypothetical protein Ahy_B06g079962 isoform D [Arachis hypogaea]